MFESPKNSNSLSMGRESDFENFKKIGRGAFASVYRCTHKIDKSAYALKKIKIEGKEAEEKINKIYSEVKQLSSLSHENIVRYYGCWCSCTANSVNGSKSSCSLSPEKSRHASTISNDTDTYSWSSQGRAEPLLSREESRGKFSPLRIKKWKEENLNFDLNIEFIGDFEDETQEEKKSPYKTFKKMDTAMIDERKDDEEKKEFFIQMELCQETLKEYLKRRNELCYKRGLNHEETLLAFGLAKQLIRALCYLREKNILHRDIKPSNIFVSEGEVLKIGDFGLVKECKDSLLDPSPIESPAKIFPGKLDCSTDDTFDLDDLDRKFTPVKYEMKEFDFDSLPKASLKMRKYTSDVIYPKSKFSPKAEKRGLIEIQDKSKFTASADKNLRRARSKSCYYIKEELTSNIGTRLYASPEQTDSKYYSYKTDHFSAALILLEIFYPIFTEMQRIQVLTKARNGQLPLDFQVRYPDLNKALTSLLQQDPWRRLDLIQISSLVSKEELKFRKKTSLTQKLLFKKEGNMNWVEKYVMLKDSTLFLYSDLESQKAETVFDLRKFSHSLAEGVIIVQNDHVRGFSLKNGKKEKEGEIKHFYDFF